MCCRIKDIARNVNLRHVLYCVYHLLHAIYSCQDPTNSTIPLQAIVVNEILAYIEKPDLSTVTYGAGLAVALFASEFFKAFFFSMLWAINLRTAVRLKGAFSGMAFEKVISLRVHSGISMGEVEFYRRLERISYVLYIP